MFTDESRFSLETDDKRIRIWRKQGTRNQPHNIFEHHAFRGGSIMVALVRAVSSRFPPPVTLIELETVLQEEW
ncbi:hypothetical protein TNCV_1818411 [Trichonephila clavipes]|nr:hypothetical protein TNCV_1818411 [Trichonephila clavipes]